MPFNGGLFTRTALQISRMKPSQITLIQSLFMLAPAAKPAGR